MTDTDRQRLAAILGMLGSEHAGERAAAGLQAEAFRRKHGLTWAQMLQPVVLNIPARQPEPPEPPAWVPPEPAPQQASPVRFRYGWDGERIFYTAYAILIVPAALVTLGLLASLFG